MSSVYKIILVLLASLIVLYAFQAYYPTFMHVFSNSFLAIIASAAVICSGFSLQKYWHRAKEQFSIVWLFFTLGLFLWFVGEAIRVGYTLVWNVEMPFPSLADVFWLGGCIPLFIALYLYVEIFKSVLSREIFAASVTVTLGLALFVSISVITPVVRTEDVVTRTMGFLYPILDMALLSMAFLGLLIFLKGSLGKSWAFICSGVLLNAWADVLFSYTELRRTYYAGHPIELLYAVSYMFFLLAFYVHVKEL
ncbi:MAG: hypothetical protein QHH18_05520 [Candidatus Bathyarchaeota archaeon]|nr:hypothetical protein [Candidatus Bathyarchaeota archaeon A05DMB-5]MDH7558048.1 hypothetical protein [Candidatus Bathyarchaeota archaeon]